MKIKNLKKVAVIGFDCAEPHLIEKLISEGHLPTFKKFRDEGVFAENCLPIYPTITPPSWTTIATGAWPGTHGVTDFHLPDEGKTPDNLHIWEAFSSANNQAEYIWEALDKAGKKCIVINYPASWPSRMKNGIQLGGAGLTVGEYRDRMPQMGHRQQLCDDQLITTGVYPWSIRIQFLPASGWKGVPDLGPEPLEAAVNLNFPNALEQPAPLTWYLLARQTGEHGYDSVTLSPEKDFSKAFFTLKPRSWSPKISRRFKMADGSEREAFFRGKLVDISQDAADLRLFLTSFCQVDGWSSPPAIAREINSPEGVFGPSGGLIGYVSGWIDLETYVEINEYHDAWLGDAVTTVLKNHPWELFYMHSHPIDWLYHIVMTEMDRSTCKNEDTFKEAWDAHLRIHQSQDRLLKRILDVIGNDAFTVIVSDHGAVADGPMYNVYKTLEAAGLCVFEQDALPDGKKSMQDKMKYLRSAPNPYKSKAIPQRSGYVYINLKGRQPEGIVDPDDYEKVQRQIIDSLYTWVDPDTGMRPVSLALAKRDARILGLHGDRIGDVIYAVYPEFGAQHGQQLPTAEWGVGKLKSLLMLRGPGVKSGHRMQRTCWLTDVVPTVCYAMDWPVPAQTEGSVIYQAFK